MRLDHLLKLPPVIILSLSIFASIAAGETRSEHILPETTQAVFIISNMGETANAFNATQLGQLMSDGTVTAFLENLQEEFDKKFAAQGFKIGVDSSEVMTTVTGELAVAGVRPAEGKLSACLLAEVSADVDAAQDLLDKARERVLEKGGEELPDEKEGEITIRGMKLEHKKGAHEEITIYSTIVKDWIVGGEDLAIVREMIRKLQGSDTKTLADVPAFQKVMKESASTGVPLGKAYTKYYIDIFGFADAIIDRLPGKKEVIEVKSKFAVLRKYGYDGIKAVGAITQVGLDDYEILMNGFIFAPGTKDEKITADQKGLDFRNNEIDILPENWIPAQSASHFSLVWDMENALEKGAPVLGDLFAGKPDAIEKTLKVLKEDPQGVMVDIENDILGQIGKKITIVTDSKAPLGIDSERLLMLVKIDGDEDVFKKAVGKIAIGEMEAGTVEEIEFEDFKLWKRTPVMNGTTDGGPVIEIPGEGPDIEVPGLCGPADDIPGLDDEDEDEEKKRQRLLKQPLVPTQIFVVAYRHLIITNDLEYTKQLLDAMKNQLGKGMRDEDEFKRVNNALDKINPGSNSLRRFVKLDKAFALTYKLLREGKLRESKSIIGAILNSVITSEDGKTDRRPIVDASKLPADYEKKIGAFLGPFGLSGKTLPDGWLFSGILLRKE